MRSATRARIVEVAARLLQRHGPAAVTTRAVAEGAGVQAPTIYRLFGDKDGLLEAVAEHVMAAHVATKRAHVRRPQPPATRPARGPADELGGADRLRAGQPGRVPDAERAGPGRWAPPPRGRASGSSRPACTASPRRAGSGWARRAPSAWSRRPGVGVIQMLLTTAPEHRDPGLPESVYDAVLGQILTDPPAHADDGPTAAAVAFRALAPGLAALTDAERALVVEWLDRVIDRA